MSELGSGSPIPQTTSSLSCLWISHDSYSNTQYPILWMTYTFKLLSSQITQNESFLISQTFKYIFFLCLGHSELLKPINMGWVLEVTKREPSPLSGLLTEISSLVILMQCHWWHTEFQMLMYIHTYMYTQCTPSSSSSLCKPIPRWDSSFTAPSKLTTSKCTISKHDHIENWHRREPWGGERHKPSTWSLVCFQSHLLVCSHDSLLSSLA